MNVMTDDAVYDHVVTFICNSIEPRFLDHLARFVLKKQTASVTEEDLGLAITRRCLSLQSRHISGIDQFFHNQLKMDLRIEVTEVRILNCFVLFDKIFDAVAERMSHYIVPKMERLVIATRVLEKDDIALYEALVERVSKQNH
ncbi:unnamed protein product [Peronospora belbahrii]|uniref:Cullin N-terminal domain-containing protein n=1 Tax=Peronospora belbahrii TaxID=622444 RepID=A0ABN8CXR4_9STRA|nr:unnamed protein product [Peronospora belbahrii]